MHFTPLSLSPLPISARKTPNSLLTSAPPFRHLVPASFSRFLCPCPRARSPARNFVLCARREKLLSSSGRLLLLLLRSPTKDSPRRFPGFIYLSFFFVPSFFFCSRHAVIHRTNLISQPRSPAPPNFRLDVTAVDDEDETNLRSTISLVAPALSITNGAGFFAIFTKIFMEWLWGMRNFIFFQTELRKLAELYRKSIGTHERWFKKIFLHEWVLRKCTKHCRFFIIFEGGITFYLISPILFHVPGTIFDTPNLILRATEWRALRSELFRWKPEFLSAIFQNGQSTWTELQRLWFYEIKDCSETRQLILLNIHWQ